MYPQSHLHAGVIFFSPILPKNSPVLPKSPKTSRCSTFVPKKWNVFHFSKKRGTATKPVFMGFSRCLFHFFRVPHFFERGHWEKISIESVTGEIFKTLPKVLKPSTHAGFPHHNSSVSGGGLGTNWGDFGAFFAHFSFTGEILKFQKVPQIQQNQGFKKISPLNSIKNWGDLLALCHI